MKVILPKITLEEYYMTMSMDDIAKKLGTCRDLIRNNLIYYNIPIHKKSWNPNRDKKYVQGFLKNKYNKLEENKEKIILLYCQKNKTIKEIAKEINISYSLVSRFLKIHNITITSKGRFKRNDDYINKLKQRNRENIEHFRTINLGEKNPAWKTIISKEELIDLYVNKEFGIDRISKMKGTAWNVIKRRLILWGIPQREYKIQHSLGIQQSIEKFRGASKGSKNPMFGKISYPKLRFVPELGHGVRSKWEENIAFALKNNNILYDYEKHHFKINGGEETYTPDFPIRDTNIFVEVKGYLSKKSREKMVQFKKEYPNLILTIITSEKNLKRCDFSFADKIFFIEKTEDMIGWLNENRKNN